MVFNVPSKYERVKSEIGPADGIKWDDVLNESTSTVIGTKYRRR